MPRVISRHGIAVKLFVLLLLLTPVVALTVDVGSYASSYNPDSSSYLKDELTVSGSSNGLRPPDCDEEAEGVSTSHPASESSDETDPCPKPDASHSDGPGTGAVAVAGDDPCDDEEGSEDGDQDDGDDGAGPSPSGGGPMGPMASGGIPPVHDLWKEPISPSTAIADPIVRPRTLDSPSVKAATGEVVWKEVDMRLPSIGPDFVLSRSFYSAMKTFNGDFGAGWENSLKRHIEVRQWAGTDDPSLIVAVRGASHTKVYDQPFIANSTTWFKDDSGKTFFEYVAGGSAENDEFVEYLTSGSKRIYERLEASEDIFYLKTVEDQFDNVLEYYYVDADDTSLNGVAFATEWVLDFVVDAEGRHIEVDWRTDAALVSKVAVWDSTQTNELMSVSYDYAFPSTGKADLVEVEGVQTWKEHPTSGNGHWDPILREYEYINRVDGTLLNKVKDSDESPLVEFTYQSNSFKANTVIRGGNTQLGVGTYTYGSTDALGTFNEYLSAEGQRRRFYVDASNRISRLREVVAVDGQGVPTDWRDTIYEYDSNCGCGRVSKITFPDGMVQEFYYTNEGRIESVWTGDAAEANWRVERFEWTVFDPPTSKYFLRMTARDAVRNADDQELPGDECSDPACGGSDPASGHIRVNFTWNASNGRLESVNYGDIQVEAGPPVYESREEHFTWHTNGVMETREERLDGVAVAKKTWTLGTGGQAYRVVTVKYDDLLNAESWTTSISYDSLGRKSEVTHPDSSKTKYEWDDRGFPIFIHQNYSGASGERTFEYWYNDRGLPHKSFVHDTAGTKPSEAIEYFYDAASQMTRIDTTGLNGAFEKDRELFYDKDGYITEIHEWNGQDEDLGAFVYKYEYDLATTGALHLLAKVTRNWDPQTGGGYGKTETVWEAGDGTGTVLDAYDDRGRLLAWRDSIGLKNYQTFDAFGRLRRKYKEAEATKYTAAEYKYNSRGYVREIEVGGIEGTPASPTRVWWDQHRKFKVNNEGDLLYAEVYEGQGGAQALVPSRRQEFDIDGWGRVLSHSVYHGKRDATASMVQIAVSEYDYDALGRVTQRRWLEDVAQSTNVDTVDVIYNDVLRQVETVRTVTGSNGFSEKWVTKYDALGRPYEDIQHEWDASTSTFGATRTWKTSWDFLDRAWASEDPLGVRFEQGFDGRGRLDWEKRVAAGGGASHTTDFQYHTTNGTLWKVVDAEGAVTQFDTDPLNFNRLLKTTYADGRFEEIDSRDSYGRVTGLSDSRTDLERTLTYSYGRLVSDVATWGSNNNIVGPAKLTWEYDIEDREVTSKVFTESGGAYTQVWETHRDFNWIGELVSETQGAGSDAMTWSFESGYSGELRRVDYPTGLGLTKGVFQYSDDGRPLSAEYHDSALVADYQFAYHGGRLATRTDLESDIRLETGYDEWGHLTKVEWAHDNGSTWDLLDGQERAFDTASRVIARKRSIDTNGEVFEHDAFGRLEDWYQGVPSALSHTPGSAPSTWGTLESYDLNKVYARTQVTKQVSGQSATTETYGSTGGAHFYDTVPDGQGGTKGRSEYEGYLSDDSDYLFRYDAWGRLTEVERKSDNTIIREHLYDASGRRVRTTDDSGQATRFLYWGGRHAAQFDEGASPANIRTYGYAGGGDSESFVVNTGAGSANGTFDIARDFQGSILALTDRSTGAVVERYRYSAFGEVSIEDGQGAALTTSAYANDRFFMGRPFDIETGYYDVRARWYDPRTGSFISPDPWGAVDSWNMYQYGFATPGTWLDPNGLSAGTGLIRAGLTLAPANPILGGVLVGAGLLTAFGDEISDGAGEVASAAGGAIASYLSHTGRPPAHYGHGNQWYGSGGVPLGITPGEQNPYLDCWGRSIPYGPQPYIAPDWTMPFGWTPSGSDSSSGETDGQSEEGAVEGGGIGGGSGDGGGDFEKKKQGNNKHVNKQVRRWHEKIRDPKLRERLKRRVEDEIESGMSKEEQKRIIREIAEDILKHGN